MATRFDALRKAAFEQGDSKDAFYRNKEIGSPQEYIGETYQGIFAGTRIATLGFAMATTGLTLPGLSGMAVVERPACGIPAPIPGPAARGLSRWRHCPLGGRSHRRFDHAQLVKVPPRHALCGGRSLSQPCDHTSTARRTSPFLTDT